ncbi:MAG: type II toxin-antitoxin system RelE/ParE family toxin [Sedimentisphaerales bacterium]
MYTVKLKPQAQKFIEAQSKKVQRQLIQRIEALQEGPRPPASKCLEAKKKIYRVRSGNFRIIYQIKDKELLVIVAKAADRKDVYTNLKSLLQSLSRG